MSLFKSKVVQEGGLYSSATTLNEEQLFLVRFRQISPPIYQVKVYIGAEILYEILASVGTIDFAHSFALTRPLQSNNISTTDLGTTLATNLGKFDFAILQERILNFVLLKTITESFAVLSTPQKNLSKILPIDLIDISDIATISPNKKISLDTEILTDLIKFVEKRSFDAPEAESFVTKVFSKALENNLNIQEDQNIDFAKVLANLAIAAGIIQSLDVEKVLANQSLVDFLRTITLSKPLSDQTEVDFTHTFNNTKSAKDDLNIQEDQILDFTKAPENISNAAGIIRSLDVEKILENQSLVDFLRTITLSRPLSDQTEVDFTQTLNTNKSAKDDLNIQEDQIFDFSKILTNQSLIDFLRSIALSKPLENTSQIATAIAKTLVKSLVDEAQTLEDTNIFDGSLFTLIKTLLNRVDVSEQISLLFDAIRLFEHVAETTDNVSLGFSTDFVNEVEVPLDDILLHFDKSRSDSVSSIDDRPVFDLEKTLSDIANAAFSVGLSLSKATIEDSVNISIAQEITRETGKNANNQIEVTVNRTLLVGKSIDDATLLPINLAKVSEKPLTNQSLVDSLFAASTSKPFQNDVASSIMININTNKKFSENPTADSTGLIRNQGYALEDYFLEGYVGQELTF
jgi:hypothetical protein